MAYEAKILLDSISPTGNRLTTFQITFPRMILSEFNTHRALCLAGDSELEFDLPSGAPTSKRRVHRMRLDEFVDKWHNGARRTGANPKIEYDTSKIDPEQQYTPKQIQYLLGMENCSNINHMCSTGKLKAIKDENLKQWLIYGKEILNWRTSKPEHTRFDIRSRLKGMKIRQYNEDTQDIQWSYVVDCTFSGEKQVFEVKAGNYKVAGSADHRILTLEGYKKISELTIGDGLIVQKFGKRLGDKTDPDRLLRIGGKWRSQWQRAIRKNLIDENNLCRRCNTNDGVDIHHIIPVYRDPSQAFNLDNITLLCKDCHDLQHTNQDWQGGTYLYGAIASVESVTFRGVEPTYDLCIAGKYENFLANGVVVHNSRNSASSRAIPVEKQIKKVLDDPFIPVYWGKNQKGMQADVELSEEEILIAKCQWLKARDYAVSSAQFLMIQGVHKQITNRLLEPFMWHTVIATATDWANFFSLRCSKEAQPEIKVIADMMLKLYKSNEPLTTPIGFWHMPLIQEEEKEEYTVADRQGNDVWRKISAARCARVSYLTHDGKRDLQADLDLFQRLTTSGHWSPLEHVAECLGENGYHGNFKGWKQYRKYFSNENRTELP